MRANKTQQVTGNPVCPVDVDFFHSLIRKETFSVAPAWKWNFKKQQKTTIKTKREYLKFCKNKNNKNNKTITKWYPWCYTRMECLTSKKVALQTSSHLRLQHQPSAQQTCRPVLAQNAWNSSSRLPGESWACCLSCHRVVSTHPRQFPRSLCLRFLLSRGMRDLQEGKLPAFLRKIWLAPNPLSSEEKT